MNDDSLGGRCGGNVVLPHPFHQLSSVWDIRAKGSWILAHVSPNWEVVALKCQPGIQTIVSSAYQSQDGLTLIQCPNVTRKSVRFVAIGTETLHRSSRNEFTTLDNGNIDHHTFLCIVQGDFLSPLGELCYIYNKLQSLSVIGSFLTSTMKKYYEDPNLFCKIAFEYNPSTSINYAVSSLYLNQISGQTLLSWNVLPSVNIEHDTLFIQASMQPDSWCNILLSHSSILKKCVKFTSAIGNST